MGKMPLIVFSLLKVDHCYCFVFVMWLLQSQLFFFCFVIILEIYKIEYSRNFEVQTVIRLGRCYIN